MKRVALLGAGEKQKHGEEDEVDQAGREVGTCHRSLVASSLCF